jgi:GT2 family glycosyltransferase
VTDPAVSVIVPTYQRGRLAARSLTALAAVEPPAGGFDVVVVDDGSAEEHRAVLRAAVAALPNARLIEQPNAGPAAARNAGINATTGALVAFLDDDCSPAADWLVRLVEPFAAADPPGGVGGRVLPAPPTNWMTRFCAVTEYSSGLQPVFQNAATANACFRRDVLDEAQGFDEGFVHPGGDDPDLSARVRAAGHRLEFVPGSIVYHAELESLGDFVRHMHGRGIGEARLAGKQGRRGRVALRAALAPLFLLRTGVGVWRRTAGKGSLAHRVLWLGVETAGRAAFVVGSVRGLLRGAA